MERWITNHRERVRERDAERERERERKREWKRVKESEIEWKRERIIKRKRDNLWRKEKQLFYFLVRLNYLSICLCGYIYSICKYIYIHTYTYKNTKHKETWSTNPPIHLYDYNIWCLLTTVFMFHVIIRTMKLYIGSTIIYYKHTRL